MKYQLIRSREDKLKSDNERLRNENSKLSKQLSAHDLFLYELRFAMLKAGVNREVIDLLKNQPKKTSK